MSHNQKFWALPTDPKTGLPVVPTSNALQSAGK